MGGSLSLGLRGKCAALYGIDPHLPTLELALSQHIVDYADSDPARLLPEADLVILSAPVPAIRSAMEKAGWTVADVDLFEVNEAFAMVPMIAMKELGIPAEKLNVNGGGTALGHPIGASGARIIATLIAALQNRGLKRGIASLCIGGGEGTAIAVEIA